MDFKAQVTQAVEKLNEKLISWVDTTILMLPNLVIAIIVFALFAFIGYWFKRLVPKALSKVSGNIAMNKLMGTIVAMIWVIIGLFVALGIMNLDKTVTSLLAGVGVVGIALGFAFQDSAANFISGVVMAVRYPLNVGDMIETNDVFGIVEKIGIRYSIVKTPQGQQIVIPNRMILENILDNYTLSGMRRIDLECGISYGDDLEKVKEVATKAIEDNPEIHNNRDVEFFYTGFGDSSINFVVRYWITFNRQMDFFSARSCGVMALKKAFDENDITIPFPIRTLDFGIKGGEKLSEQQVQILSSQNGS